MLSRTLRQRRELISRTRDSFRGFLGNGYSDLPRLIEDDGVPVDDLERGNWRITLHTSHCLLRDRLYILIRVERAAVGTARSGVRISKKMTFYPAVVTRRGGERSNVDVTDPENDRVARHRAVHIDGHGHFVSASNSRGNHWTPTTRRTVSHNGSTRCYGAQHGFRRIQNTVGQFRNHDRPSCFFSCLSHAFTPFLWFGGCATRYPITDSKIAKPPR